MYPCHPSGCLKLLKCYAIWTIQTAGEETYLPRVGCSRNSPRGHPCSSSLANCYLSSTLNFLLKSKTLFFVTYTFWGWSHVSSQYDSPRMFFHNLLQKLLHAPGLAQPSARCRPMGRRVGSCFLPGRCEGTRWPGKGSKIIVQSLRKLIYIPRELQHGNNFSTYHILYQIGLAKT